MNQTKRRFLAIILSCSLLTTTPLVRGQSTSTPHISLWEGMLVTGYVGKGAYINCGGPSVKWTLQPFSLSIGLFPAVRIKKDNSLSGTTKNAAIMPSTGVGITSSFKHLVLQIPLFYDSKTVTNNGKWHAGIGVGYKF